MELTNIVILKIGKEYVRICIKQAWTKWTYQLRTNKLHSPHQVIWKILSTTKSYKSVALGLPSRGMPRYVISHLHVWNHTTEASQCRLLWSMMIQLNCCWNYLAEANSCIIGRTWKSQTFRCPNHIGREGFNSSSFLRS